MTEPESGNDLQAQRDAYEKRRLFQEGDQHKRRWYETHGRLIRALADAFGEDDVLDIAEKTWWDLGYEAGLAWREKFERDPYAAMQEKAHSWHDSAMFGRGCCGDLPVLTRDHWELRVYRCHKEIFMEMGDPKIGMTWCMRDFATVRGWSPRISMRQPTHLLRGDNYCHQIREITDDPALQWDYSRETSEKVGWRSIKKLEAQE